MKKALSLILAIAITIAMLPIGSGFVANAACTTGVTDLLEFGEYLVNAGSVSKWYDSVLVDNGETGSADDPIIIDSAEEFVYLAKGIPADTAGKYYKVADGITAFDLSKGNLNLGGTLAENIDIIKSSGKNHAGSTPGFQGTFDGNGVTVYGAWTNHTEGNIGYYAGLFNYTKGNVTIKNVNVKLSSFTAKYSAGGIVGYYEGDSTQTLTVENCSVSDTHLEVLETGWGHGIGAIVGHADNLDSFIDTNDTDGDGNTEEEIWINGPVVIRNCFVNLDEKYFISPFEKGTQTDTTLRGVHGGIAGFMNTNALSVSDCIVIGVTPYATTSCTAYKDVQHSGLEHHFANVYTDANITDIDIGGDMGIRNFTGCMTKLSTAQMKGALATQNMNLDRNVWIADDSDYPQLRSTHKNISFVSNGDDTHTEICECGFGGLTYSCTYQNDKCIICQPQISCSNKKTVYWDGTISYGFSDQSAGTKDDPVIINTASELAYLAISTADVSTLADGSPKYFKIADGIGNIVLQHSQYAQQIMSLKNSNAVKTFFEDYSRDFLFWPHKSWEQSSFCGYLDGNGAKIYGLYQLSNNNAGLFSSIDAGASIHNIAVMNSYLSTSATNYQIGAIAAVGNGIDYGAKSNGVIWFDTCIVANCYMRNSASDTYEKQRSGIIMGNAYEDAVVIDNCLVYGNDAYSGASYQYKISLVGSARNNVHATARKPAELNVKIEKNVENTGIDMIYNSVRNTVALDCDIVNTRLHCSYRLNVPECFENCYTDGVSGTVNFSDGFWTYTNEELVPITAEQLRFFYISDAWVTTDTLPALKTFHTFTPIDNGDGTHTLICDCGVTGVPNSHTTGEPIKEIVTSPGCITSGLYELIYNCTECNKEIYRQPFTINALGHTYDDELDTDCNVCGESAIPVTYGDVNDDGWINNKDYVVLIRYINDWDVKIITAACDVNRDGQINNKDCSILMQYINNRDICLHKFAAATCTLPKTCIDCGETIGNALGHNYVTGECNRINGGELCGNYSEEYCPKLYFTGDMSQITRADQTSKKIVCDIDVEYRSKEQIVNRSAQIKIQGTSSTQWRKKNYTITFFEDDSYDNKMGIDVGWGEQSKYCLKANWIDKTHSRNVVTAKLVGEVQQKYNLFETTPNGGAIDGFPVEIYINGEFHGLYTMNIPKDEWQFDMDKDNPNHIVICGENWNDPVLFKDDPNLSDWSVEVGPENDETLAKIKRLSDFIRFSTDEEFKANIHQYLNLDATLNYYVLMDYAYMMDNRGKNMLLVTYDGNVWYPSLYDLDTTWGTNWRGDGEYSYQNGLGSSIRQSLLWERIEKLYSKELAARYFELRYNILDPEYVMSKFNEFYALIPQEVLQRETEKWTLPDSPIPGYDFSQIQRFLDTLIPRLDTKYANWL